MLRKMLNAGMLLFAVSVVLVACKKDDRPGADANVMLVNAVPGDTASYDFYFNDVKLNSQSVSFPSYSNYLPLQPKDYTIKVAANNTINPVVSAGYSVSSGRNYSVYVYDTLQSGKLKVFALEDDLSAPPAGKVKLRFLHLSPVGIPVNILADDSTYFSNRSYADVVGNEPKAGFVTMDAGTYTFQAKLAGSDSSVPALLTLPNVQLNAGSVYTLVARGKLNASGSSTLGLTLITNK